jgi:hypothetical protein
LFVTGQGPNYKLAKLVSVDLHGSRIQACNRLDYFQLPVDTVLQPCESSSRLLLELGQQEVPFPVSFYEIEEAGQNDT